ncbi:uncharacterized protein VTP21DRAFT_10388 [Calcarisporiella thermophila]|uniref:uncharacterized protein n=1 Tax=Calcarisporiella thermophila TaxID=911321 RepID=UPI0037423C72
MLSPITNSISVPSILMLCGLLAIVLRAVIRRERSALFGMGGLCCAGWILLPQSFPLPRHDSAWHSVVGILFIVSYGIWNTSKIPIRTRSFVVSLCCACGLLLVVDFTNPISDALPRWCLTYFLGIFSVIPHLALKYFDAARGLRVHEGLLLISVLSLGAECIFASEWAGLFSLLAFIADLTFASNSDTAAPSPDPAPNSISSTDPLLQSHHSKSYQSFSDIASTSSVAETTTPPPPSEVATTPILCPTEVVIEITTARTWDGSLNVPPYAHTPFSLPPSPPDSSVEYLSEGCSSNSNRCIDSLPIQKQNAGKQEYQTGKPGGLAVDIAEEKQGYYSFPPLSETPQCHVLQMDPIYTLS